MPGDSCHGQDQFLEKANTLGKKGAGATNRGIHHTLVPELMVSKAKPALKFFSKTLNTWDISSTLIVFLWLPTETSCRHLPFEKVSTMRVFSPSKLYSFSGVPLNASSSSCSCLIVTDVHSA